LASDDRLTVTDGPSVLAPPKDHLAMLLKGVQARLLNQLVNDLFLPSNTLLRNRNVSLGLSKVVLLKGVVHGRKP
jgi:hypothetical protein